MELKDRTLFREAALIGSEWVEARAGEAIDVVNPANGQTIGQVPRLGGKAARAAIEAGLAAQKDWAATTPRSAARCFGPGST